MDKPAKDAIRELVLKLRKTLEGEIERELGRYGLYADRDWIPAADLPRLTAKERDEDRPRIEAAIQRERDAGLERADAVRAFIRETAYTHMNRLLGLKCMEVRGLIAETITTRAIYSDRSQRHRDYLDEHPRVHREPDRGLVAMLQGAYAEASQQIGVVFDPDSDYSVVWPRHTVLKECIAWINALRQALRQHPEAQRRGQDSALDADVARRRGQEPEASPSVYADDTFLGWVYQYFQEEEKKRVFYEVGKKKKKIGGQDIIPATTAYTERYMVQFLVENSLGALWMEMYPDSDLFKRWDYFVEDPNLRNEVGSRRRGREPRPVAELTLLDPACGSGHFLLYAFDVFAQMYEAEAGMQGRLVDRAEIARSILRHNLYGIDIDLRSAQLSALNLYMKACTYADVRLDALQDGGSVQMNLVCADIVLRRGVELKELLDRFKGDTLTQDLIKTLWRGLENARELGSLLKVEEQVDEVIARKREAERGTFWEHGDETWELWKQSLLDLLKAYVDRTAESFDVNRRMFGQEAIKGVQLLDLLTRRYDVVTTNPPYMGHWNMSSLLLDNVKNLFPRASTDLYACFIERCVALSRLSGSTAMITQHTFMFTRRYCDMRVWLLSNIRIRTIAHLGTHAFEDIAGEKVNTVMFVFKKSRDPAGNSGIYVDLNRSFDKANSLREILAEGESFFKFLVDQRQFDSISSRPMAYWISDRVFEIFRSAPPLDDGTDDAIAQSRRGVDTGEVSRFVRYVWEIPSDHICRDHGKHNCSGKWHLHLRGGEFNRVWLKSVGTRRQQ